MDYQIDYKNFYEHSPDMFLSVEPETAKIIACNRTMQFSLGYKKEELLGKKVIEIYSPECHEKVKENLRSFRQTGALIHSELKVLKKNGQTIDVSLKLTPIRDERGRLLYSNAILRDITELKQIQRALQQEKETSERLLLNILPECISGRLKQNTSIIADGIASSTILFSDIVGFTTMSEQMSPEQLIILLNTIFTEFDNLVETHELEKIKTIGDAYMIASGVPVARDDHAAAIAELALEMKNIMTELNRDSGIPLDIRIGVNSGPVIAGVIGKKKFAYDLWGDTVNTAARMESHGIPGEIQITEATYKMLKGKYVCEERGIIEVKGKGPMKTYLLKGR
jgi:PAS domain S-box-containing protein